MNILLLCTAYNGLTQRAHLALQAEGHDVYIELALSDRQMCQAFHRVQPDLIICPFLKRKVPASIWRKTRTIIIHPGVTGDRGASSLDWAIHDELDEWGVTAIEASEEFDAGDIWATQTFKMRPAPKASIYRQEVTDAAISCILKSIKAICAGEEPTPLARIADEVNGRLRPLMQQRERAIDWRHDSTQDVILKINAADSFPGVLSRLYDLDVYLYGAHEEGMYRGVAGQVIAQRDSAICIATTDGAVWISHLRRRGNQDKRYFKLPAAEVLGARLTAPERLLDAFTQAGSATYREIWYHESERVGYLHFDFHNGAMSTEQCQRLQRAFQRAKARPTEVIALVGGEEFHSNGIHLNIIEAADDSVAESWDNINAINDLIEEIITCTSQITVSAVQGNAGAGGVIFAVACDYVVARSGRVFNPHYRTMGLHGSEYWTYLLPRRIGEEWALNLTESCLPINAEHALRIGLIDAVIDARGSEFMGELAAFIDDLCQRNMRTELLQLKRERLASDAPLEQYRVNELAEMLRDFNSPVYQSLRRAFVYKESPKETPAYLMRHRQREWAVA